MKTKMAAVYNDLRFNKKIEKIDEANWIGDGKMDKVESKDSSQEEIIMQAPTSNEETVDAVGTVSVDSEEIVEENSEITELAKLETVEQTEEQDVEKTNDNLGVISDNLQELSNKVDQMNQLFIQKIAHTTHEEKIVDQMHTELQKYKQDLYAQLIRPILLDIIEMRDSILRMSAGFASRPEGEQNVPLKTFSDYAYDVQDILEKNNITIYNSKEGDDFSPIKQKAIKKVTTPVLELHGKIAESLSSGYDYLGKPISPEKVVVYVYKKTENEEGDINNG